MYPEISNPMDYHVALYIRLSKEDENEGPSESVTNQKSLLDDFVKKSQFTYYTADALSAVADSINYFANKEGLRAHGKSAMIRKEK